MQFGFLVLNVPFLYIIFLLKTCRSCNGMWKEFNGKCYAFFTEKHPPLQAEAQCSEKANGGKFVQRFTMDEYYFLQDRKNKCFGASYRVAIGYRFFKTLWRGTEWCYWDHNCDLKTQNFDLQGWNGWSLQEFDRETGSFRWETNINDRRDMCAAIADIGMVSVWCETPFPFVCENEPAKANPYSCRSSPCRNGGKCIPRCEGYDCRCPSGFRGRKCQFEVFECASRPCQNGGVCVDYVNKYRCECRPGYTGSTCQTEVNECFSAPCANRGICQDHLNSYTCDCKPGYVGSSCEHEPPGKLFHTCKDWVVENQDLNCSCSIEEFGKPRALVGWKHSQNDTDLRPALLVRSVRRGGLSRSYTCQMTWSRPDRETETRSITYQPRVAYGPTSDNTVIEGDNVLNTTGLENVTLECYSESAKPEPKVEWKGVTCDEGNFVMSCTFTPDPSNTKGMVVSVKCTLVNPYSPDLRGIATHNITLIWEGMATVTLLEVGGSSENYVSNKTSQRLQLVCEAIGDPLPDDVEVFLFAGRNTTLQKGGKRLQGGTRTQRNKNKLVRKYTVFSPALCGRVDTYRCHAHNFKGNHSKRVVVLSDCPAASPSRAPIGGVHVGTLASVLGSLAGLAGLVASALYGRHRWRKEQFIKATVRAMDRAHSQSQAHRILEQEMDEAVVQSRSRSAANEDDSADSSVDSSKVVHESKELEDPSDSFGTDG
ncbi:hypothetical protein BaRGS_00025601 [Batillaria attramentaria]|uniref:Uncharacterized protein n=1 Tax=Batillaria attramentaria TaxID=370345 RepID=A0ABD0K7Y8_9CAEN